MKETGMEIQDIWGCVFHGFVCLCVCSGFFRGVGGGGGGYDEKCGELGG